MVDATHTKNYPSKIPITAKARGVQKSRKRTAHRGRSSDGRAVDARVSDTAATLPIGTLTNLDSTEHEQPPSVSLASEDVPDDENLELATGVDAPTEIHEPPKRRVSSRVESRKRRVVRQLLDYRTKQQIPYDFRSADTRSRDGLEFNIMTLPDNLKDIHPNMRKVVIDFMTDAEFNLDTRRYFRKALCTLTNTKISPGNLIAPIDPRFAFAFGTEQQSVDALNASAEWTTTPRELQEEPQISAFAESRQTFVHLLRMIVGFVLSEQARQRSETPLDPHTDLDPGQMYKILAHYDPLHTETNYIPTRSSTHQILPPFLEYYRPSLPEDESLTLRKDLSSRVAALLRVPVCSQDLTRLQYWHLPLPTATPPEIVSLPPFASFFDITEDQSATEDLLDHPGIFDCHILQAVQSQSQFNSCNTPPFDVPSCLYTIRKGSRD